MGGIMALEGSGKMQKNSQGKNFIYVATKVAEDSQFPFDHQDKLKIRVDGDRVIVEKAEEE